MTMHFIASQTLATPSQMFFTSIPQTYTHLQIRVYARGTNTSVNESLLMACNNETTAGRYSFGHYFHGNGSSVTGTYVSDVAGYHYSTWIPAANGATGAYGAAIIDILNYTNSTRFKPIRGWGGHDQNNTNGYVGQHSGQYASTSPITALSFAVTGAPYNLAAGTRVDIYGISNNPIATGA